MLKQVISQGDYAVWSQFALVLFFVTFVGILLWVRRKEAGTHYDYMAGLPQDIDDRVAERSHE